MSKEFEREPIKIHGYDCDGDGCWYEHAIVVVFFDPIKYICKYQS